MTDCYVSDQIAIHCDEPEQVSANDLYIHLEKNNYVLINGEIYFYDDVTELLDFEEYENASDNEIREMYISKIQELIQ